MVQQVKGSAWISKYKLGFVSLLDLVKADGITDAKNSILSVLNAGDVLYIPPGEFVTSSITLPVGARIFGSGKGSKLKLLPGTNLPLLIAGNSVEIQELYLDGNKTNQTVSNSNGIQFTNSIGAKAKGITIVNCKGDGVNIGGVSSELDLSDFLITGSTVNGLRVAQGSNMRLDRINAFTGDPAATGDGIAIASSGNPIENIVLNNCSASYNLGRGLSILGFGSRNVTDVVVQGFKSNNNTNHNILLVNAEACSISGGISKAGTQDGVRLEGDVQFCRVSNMLIRNNAQYGLREVVAGPTPNNNGFIYNVVRGNLNNTSTIVGGSSFTI